MVKQQLPDIPVENIIDEPFGKNTAPCIGLASVIVQKRNPDAVMVVLPADHLIPDIETFQSTILTAANFAASKKFFVYNRNSTLSPRNRLRLYSNQRKKCKRKCI